MTLDRVEQTRRTEVRVITLKKCDNWNCDRLTSDRSAYCCGGCSMAQDGGYEIHDDGSPLAHSEWCDQRHEERKSYRPGDMIQRPSSSGLAQTRR